MHIATSKVERECKEKPWESKKVQMEDFHSRSNQ